MRKERPTANGIGGWGSGQGSHLGSEGTLKTLYEIFRVKIAKQIFGTSSGLQRMRDWTLRRGQPPPKRDHARSRSQKYGSTGHSGQFAPLLKKKKKLWMMVMHLDRLATYLGATQDERH
jgi:hypothetical protein